MPPLFCYRRVLQQLVARSAAVGCTARVADSKGCQRREEKGESKDNRVLVISKRSSPPKGDERERSLISQY